MQGKSNSFRQVTPFYPRMGMLADYTAFPTDNLGAIPGSPFGCLSVQPSTDFNSTSQEGDSPSPLSIIYAIKNSGGASLDWSLSISETWLDASSLSGSLAPGGTHYITISFNSEADSLDADSEPYTANLSFVNETNGCGSIILGSSLLVSTDNFLTITLNPSDVSVSVGDAPLEYRKRTGDPELIGNSEFVDPSSPPKRYRRRTLSGLAFGCLTSESPVDHHCDPNFSLPGTVAVKLTGYCEYDRLTTILDNQSSYGQTSGDCLNPPAVGSQLGPTCFYPPQSVWSLGGGNYIEVLTPTNQRYTADSVCRYGGGSNWLTATGYLNYEISVEDTEDDAIDRFRLNTGWGSYSGSAWTADWEERVSGFTFHYQESQFKVDLSGFTPGATVKVDGYILRRVHATGPFLPAGKISFTATANGGGGVTFEAYTPNERGFDSVVISAQFMEFL